MKAKRQILDTVMVLLLPLLMAYSLVGEAFHEVAGSLMLVLFIIHHWLNRAWWKNLFRGKYRAKRIFQTVLNFLLFLFMILQPLCGILMSKHLYSFLPTANLSSLARAIHLPLANWGFVLMSLHAGSGLSGFDRSLAAAYPDCTVAKGLAIAGTDAQNHPDQVQTSVAAWLDKLGF